MGFDRTRGWCIGAAEIGATQRGLLIRQEASEFHETAAATGLPLVGRASELALLLDRWTQATQGLGQVVVLSGDAGIGKSRQAAALGERVVQEGNLRIMIRCSPYHTNSALYPIMARLERLLQGPSEEPAMATVERLELLLRPTGLPLAHVVPLIAALLSVPLPEGRYTPMRLSPQQQKQQTLEALVAWLLAETARQPVLSRRVFLRGRITSVQGRTALATRSKAPGSRSGDVFTPGAQRRPPPAGKVPGATGCHESCPAMAVPGQAC